MFEAEPRRVGFAPGEGHGPVVHPSCEVIQPKPEKKKKTWFFKGTTQCVQQSWMFNHGSLPDTMNPNDAFRVG